MSMSSLDYQMYAEKGERITQVRTHNASLKGILPHNLVAIFVGGTSGIGLSTAREFVRNTTSPHIYLVGRSSSAASEAIKEFQEINPSAQTTFIQSDVSLLRNVDDVCKQIVAKENQVNLFMSCGYFTLKGKREDTAEGIDRKLALHYYSRARFISNLVPLLKAASATTSTSTSTSPSSGPATLSRVVSVLDGKTGVGQIPNFDDLGLEKPGAYGLTSAAYHACAMNTLAFEHFSTVLPGTSFVHSFPGGVNTNVGREMGAWMRKAYGVMSKALSFFFVDLKESGERHLFAATAPRYKAAGEGGEGDDAKRLVVRGSCGVKGSGAYAVNWDCTALYCGASGEKARKEGAVEKVWQHTEDVFKKVLGSEGASAA